MPHLLIPSLYINLFIYIYISCSSFFFRIIKLKLIYCIFFTVLVWSTFINTIINTLCYLFPAYIELFIYFSLLLVICVFLLRHYSGAVCGGDGVGYEARDGNHEISRKEASITYNHVYFHFFFFFAPQSVPRLAATPN